MKADMSKILRTETPDSVILEEIGDRLRALRKSRRMSQEEAARRSGISRRTLWSAEQGENPTLLTLVRLLRTYGRLGALDDFIPSTPLSPIDVVVGSRGRRD